MDSTRKTIKKSRLDSIKTNYAKRSHKKPGLNSTWADWKRSSHDIYFNNEHFFKNVAFNQIKGEEDRERKIQFLRRLIGNKFLTPQIIDYIEKYANQNGFLNCSSFLATEFLVLDKKIKADLKRRRFDFIKNVDGGFTFIEEFSVENCARFDDSGLIPALIDPDKENQPAAVIVTTSTIKLNAKNKVEHTYVSDKVYLLDQEITNELFKNEDELDIENFGAFEQRYGVSYDDVEREIAADRQSLIDNQLHLAINQLEEEFNNIRDPLLRESSTEFLRVVKEVRDKGLLAPKEIPKLTDYVVSTKNIIQDPSSENIAIHARATKAALHSNKAWGKKVGGAMLAVFGAVLIAASIVLAVGTFGVASPISAIGIALGGTAISVGTAIGAAVIATTAAVGVAGIVNTVVGAGFFVDGKKERKVSKQTEVASKKLKSVGDKLVKGVKGGK